MSAPQAPARTLLPRAVLRALAAMPLALAAWYFTSPATSWIAANLARPAISLAAGAVRSIDFGHARATYAVALEEPYAAGRVPASVEASVETNPRAYTFGLALFLALAFSVRETRRVWVVCAGLGAVLAAAAAGLAFDVLRQLMATPGLERFLAWSEWRRESVALGYQVGSLLLPTLLPVGAWLGAARSLLAQAFR